MKKLVIVESPTKAKTLSKILGKDFAIEASMGHIRDLPKKGLGVDVEHNFKPEYEIPEKAKKTVSKLKKELPGVDSIVLATDPDREGEAIAWHLKEILTSVKKYKDIPFYRVVFHELTKPAVEEAFDHMGKLNMDLVDAQQARRILDRLVGYRLSPLLWKKVRYGLSAGRVQSVAVRLVVERERERDAFKPDEYWDIKVALSTKDSKSQGFYADFKKRDNKKVEIINEKEANEIVSLLDESSYTVSEIKVSDRSKKPYPPLKTSTMQQGAASSYGMTARKAMSAAQKLFEKGLITYHRTDSLTLSSQFVGNVSSYIKQRFGDEYLPEKPRFYKTKSKNAQEAHEAIRPTDVTKTPLSAEIKKLTADEKKIYSLIWSRAVESQMQDAKYKQTSATITTDTNCELRASGSVLEFAGWLKVKQDLGIDISEDLTILPELEQNQDLVKHNVTPTQHFTQPPARYSDASLIKTLEELGIGRPSTYAPTISTIQRRGYVEKDGRYFKPKDVAYVVTDLLVEHFPEVTSYDFTATMEDALDAIAAGETKWEPIIKEFYGPFEKAVEEKDKTLNKRDVTTLEKTDEPCPECGKPLHVKLGKYGKFYSCSNYPECEYAKPMAEDLPVDEDGEVITEFGTCENCEDGHFILKQGRYGKFLACNNYPKCKTTKPYLEKIGVKCPECSDGDVIVKKAKGRTFYGCSRYPECEFSSWKKPKAPESETSNALDESEA